MKRKSERGQGRLGGLVFLVLIVAVGLAAWNVVPVYIAHYDFTDRVEEVCRTPRYKGTDEDLLRMLTDEVAKRRLDPWIGPEAFEISTVDRGRRIKLYYEREVVVLPGWKKKLKFSYTAEQPLL
jgi:hypothetical protein